MISLAPASAAGFLFLYSLCLLFSGGQSAIPYAKAVSAWFDQKRGLALGIAMSGTGIGVFVMPLFATILIDAYGWRSAFVGLAITTFAVGFPAVALFVRDPPAAASDRVKRAPATPGIPAAAAWRSGRFWLIAIAAFLVVMAVNGTNGHLVPLLMDRGLSARVAASAVAVMGLSTIAGRLIGGYLMDRIFAPYLAAGVFLLPLVPLTLLGAGAAGAGPFVAAICLGLSLGAEVDLLGFLVSRYFGLSAFGEIYGYVFAIFTFGAGIGVYFMGLSFDLARSYNPALVGFGRVSRRRRCAYFKTRPLCVSCTPACARRGQRDDHVKERAAHLRVRSRITSQNWRPDLRQIRLRPIEQDRRNSRTISRICD